MLSTLEWNKEFMRLNGIPSSKMDLSAPSTKEYFMTISRNGGYKLPAEPTATPAPVPKPSVAPTVPQNATAKQLIKTILDAAAALDKII